MTLWNSTSSLRDLKSRVLPFGLEWREATGRQLSTARDGLDFLTAMKGRDDFWAALVPSDPQTTLPVDTAALRAALPSSALPQELDAGECLRSLGLSETDVGLLSVDLDESVLVESAIRSAFQEQTPQKVARALERVLDADRDVVASECYVGRLSDSPGLGRTLGVLMGTVVLLVGTALASCAAQCGRSTTSPNASPPGQSTSAPEPSPGPGPQPPPEPPPQPPPQPPQPPPNPVPVPVPAYKGVSPKRRTAASPQISVRRIS